MSTMNSPVLGTIEPQPTSVHPWSKSIKPEYLPYIKYSHNSVNNPRYPRPKSEMNRWQIGGRRSKYIAFTVIGNRVTKEFIYCVNMVQGMHKYRPNLFAPPVIRAVTGVEWKSNTLKDLIVKYGQIVLCLEGEVAVIVNGELIGGEKELKEMIESEYYIILLATNYEKESINAFAKYLKAVGHPVAYMHIAVNGEEIGSLMFMLYSDIVPRTCENFLRLCTTKKGGYAGTPVHRIVKDGWIQCGGFGLKNTDLDCENFIVDFDRRGVLAMANAGRNVECSTQFFVLLEPNVSFKLQFVAFGQLIDGEETLNKIEELETYYEAPLDEVIIVTAGVVNLEGRDVHINKNAREYIEKHIDDLVVIGEMFYEMLLEKVFLEAEERYLQRLEEGGEEEEDAYGNYGNQGNYVPENIRETRRFIRKKSEFERAEPGKADKQNMLRNAQKTEGDNNDFDVEDYEPEEYVYSKVSLSLNIEKETRPYYLALTDVPYPGEKSSTFDLKRFLQGDYCLETDLDEKGTDISNEKKLQNDMKIKAITEIISSYGGLGWEEDSESSSGSESDTLDSEDVREIKDYIEQHGEKVSFSGNVVKSIAKKHISENPVTDKKPGEFWNDEELRRMRLALQDINSRGQKKVSLKVGPWETHPQIKRRVTGWEPHRQEEASDEEDIKESATTQDFSTLRKAADKQSVQIYAPSRSTTKINRRQTGFVPHSAIKKIEEDDDDDDKKSIASQQSTTVEIRKPSVRIAPKDMKRSLSTSKSPQSGETFYADKIRPSVLMRLYDDIAIDDFNTSPTLKDFKPITTSRKKTFTLAEDLGENIYLRKSINAFQKQLTQTRDSIDIPYTRRSVDPKPMSVDYSNRPWAEALSANLDYNRKRPSISVAQYQQKNKIEMEALAKKVEEEEARKQRKGDTKNKGPGLEGTRERSGIRLPGDTPVYSESASSLMSMMKQLINPTTNPKT